MLLDNTRFTEDPDLQSKYLKSLTTWKTRHSVPAGWRLSRCYWIIRFTEDPDLQSKYLKSLTTWRT